MPPAAGRPSAFMVAANALPLAYLACGAALVVPLRGSVLAAAIAAWLYVVPPLAARVVLSIGGRPSGVFTPGSSPYRVWWLLTQLQMPFNRVGLLEELLRLVPGVYGAWLGLWGSRVSLFAFWSPGAVPLDRWSVEVGRGAVLGTGCRLYSHAVSTNERGEYELTVSPVVVGEGAVVGASTSIGPGCRVAAHETVPVGRILPPFTIWRNGRKETPAAAGRSAG